MIRGENFFRNPTNEQIAECLGFNEAIDEVRPRDVVMSVQGRRGLRRQSMALPKDWTFWCSR